MYFKTSPTTGMAILRNNELIWYSMPGAPDGLAVRKVLIEKHPVAPYIAVAMLKRFNEELNNRYR